MPATLTAVPDVQVDYDADLARECEEWLHALDDDFLACYRNHNFPKLRPKNGKFPRGVTARPIAEVVGHFQITQRCRDCGILRTFTCTGDLFAPDRSYTYDWPAGYNMPKGGAAYLPYERILGERNRRFGKALLDLAI